MKKHYKEYHSKNWTFVIGLVLIIFAALTLTIYFLQGKTEINKPLAKIEKSDYLTCISSDNEYPLFTYDNSFNKSLKINTTFVNERLSSISLIYTLYYYNQKSIIDSENLNHATMNINYANDGLEFDALNTQFSKFSEGLQFSISTNIDNESNIPLKYFMLNNVTDQNKKEVQLTLEQQNFSCKNNIQSMEAE